MGTTRAALGALLACAVLPAATAHAQRLRSRPTLRPPAVTIDTHRPGLAAGLIFLGPKDAFGSHLPPRHQQGPMIVDDRGRVRWFHPTPEDRSISDVRVQSYRGKPVLTYWQGRAAHGHGAGVGIVRDTSYRVIARVKAGRGCAADLHEFRLTPDGTALLTCYVRTHRDLRGVGGTRHGAVLDAVFQEVDVATGRVRFAWHAFGHVRLNESHEPIAKDFGGAYDPFHINSVEKLPGGDYLVSFRHTWTVYKVDGDTGRILWRLGGNRSDFRLGRGARTHWQHDARTAGPGVIRIFDNGAATGLPANEPRSRVVWIALDQRRHTARLVRAVPQPHDLSATSQGNAQALPGGDTFVGWGSTGAFSEFARGGRLLLDGHVPEGYDSYRAYRSPWTATPRERPAAAARRGGGHTTVWASWNGATEVAAWRVLAGAGPKALQAAGRVRPWKGLETVIRGIPATARYVAVQALDAAGTVLATSPAVRVKVTGR